MPPVPRRVLPCPVEIIFAILEAGCHIHDLQQDTQFLLNASLVSRSWSLPAQMLLFRHVIIRSQAAFIALRNATSSNEMRGNDLARHVRSLSVTLDPGQPGCLQTHSFSYAVSWFPNLKSLDLAFYSSSKATPSYQSDSKPFLFLKDEEISILRSGPIITVLRLSNWSGDRSLLDRFLTLYNSSLRTLALRGTPFSFPAPTTSLSATPLHPLHLTLEPPLAPALLDWLTNPAVRPHLRALEFTRQPHHVALAALLSAHGDSLAALALPMLTTADAALVAAHTRFRLEALRMEHPYAALPPQRAHLRLRQAALAPGPALALVRREIRARRAAGDDIDIDGSASGGGGRLQHLSVMLWRGHEDEPGVVRALRLACAQLGVCLEFERDVRAFRTLFWAGVVQRG